VTDPRRRVPRTDVVLAEPRLARASAQLGGRLVKAAVAAAQQRVRDGELAAEDVVDAALAALPPHGCSLRPVLNATGVLVHTNLGRAPLSGAAADALVAAAGCTDLEYDLAGGRRAERGRGALSALAAAVPAAGAVHVVNNNAAAILLTALALGAGREVVVSRGELVEIGDGFRIPALVESVGARLREVGTTNRVHLRDYADAIGPDTGFVLKVHPSNFLVSGFTAEVGTAELAGLGPPVVVDIGSGLLRPHPLLPAEPDASTALRAGASLVTASADKLLGGPQAGLLLGDADLVQRLRRHPAARAMRVDKLTLAALEATLLGPQPPVVRMLAATAAELTERAGRLAAKLRAAGVDAVAVASTSAVGGGGAPGVQLPSAAIALPVHYAAALRQPAAVPSTAIAPPPDRPAAPQQAVLPVIGRVHDGRCLLDLRTVDPADEPALLAAVLAAGGIGRVVRRTDDPERREPFTEL